MTAAIALEQAARRFALAALETKLTARSDELERVQQELAKLTATAGTTASALVTAQSELTNITAEVKTLRDEVQAAQKDADGKFDDGGEVDRRSQSDAAHEGRLGESADNRCRITLAALRDAMDKLGVHVDIGARTERFVPTSIDSRRM